MGRLEQSMMTRRLEAGAVIYQEGATINEICIILTGSVKATGKYGENTIMAGNVLGVLDLGIGKYLYNYTANEETLICYFQLETLQDLGKVFAADKTYAGIIISSLAKQMISITGEFEKLKGLSEEISQFIRNEYEEYKQICKNYHKEPAQIKRIENLEEFEEDNAIVTADLDYFINLDLIPLELKKKFYSASEYVMMTEVKRFHENILEISDAYEPIIEYVNQVKHALFAKDEDNLFMRLAELAFMINESNGDISFVWSRIKNITTFVTKEKVIEQAVLPVLISHFKTKIKVGADLDDEQNDLTKQYTIEQIKGAKVLAKDSLATILEYSGISQDKADKFKQYLTVYNSLPDKSATTDEVDKLRKAITKIFYELYELIFFKAEETKMAEPVIDLFLNYGYVDEKFITESQLLQLFYLKQEQEVSEYPIYTMKEWLQEIYYGKAEPSKNEFDLDYQGMLREKKKTQHVSEAEEREYLKDQKGKVTFEIENMFRAANKITSGKVLTFCPILHKDFIIGTIDKLIQKKSDIIKAYEELQKIDFSLFYRTVLYHDSSKGIAKEYIEKKILPITILMPNVGSKSSMWQETSGLRKDTPARFVMPILSKEQAEDMLISVAGRYRWEICRNVQGVYWSDITEKSLTSEYYDYIQFYKKNRDLSPQAKEKLRNEITRVRNNYREVFVQDYIQWIRYESKGSSRLNKIARAILLTYCPFSKPIRTELSNFPAFSELLDRYETLQAAKIKKLENAYASIRRNGGTVTKELEDNLAFHNQ
ncbi:cyclic nucleotide-binding domain-containing protein [Candidatus Galacturonibacter soehngenii]|uniref:Cyclic nucleotide-binding domain-containing protein n=1 Tax=Candidatus Galacturonatibacter soehngenii TaxID=2307010 RepID=A0A7V7UB96_9FIRM|nr:cyclic nucleotide-binding domain-containing protein [Candidatus Galacturonibacter soehngenii]KAB1437735.1 cyclic nucleotide-binding domain-containing protein [Candidatus Galacturonibacter soehngenii]